MFVPIDEQFCFKPLRLKKEWYGLFPSYFGELYWAFRVFEFVLSSKKQRKVVREGNIP